MKKITFLPVLAIFLTLSIGLHAQDKLSAQDLEKYKEQVTNLTKFLENTLNFLGDPKSIAKEKEVVISQSYLKMFANDKVQIEDDLDENREVPLYKNVQAYLKDIGFFYRKVKFEFVIADISYYVNEKNLHYFKVTFNRTLNGMTVTRDSVSSRKVRYMEVNLDINANTLKIASIYTTKMDEKEEMKVWWNNLTQTWKNILGKNVFVEDTIELNRVLGFSDKEITVAMMPVEMNAGNDSVTVTGNPGIGESNDPKQSAMPSVTHKFDPTEIFTKLKGIKNQTHIDVSGHAQINSLSPLTELTELREINCSNTMVTDLFPIRNLNYLEILNFSQTPVADISPLYYSTTLKQLNCGFTLINDMTPIAGLVSLEQLVCEGIKITNLDFIGEMKNLSVLDCSNSRIYDLSPVKDIKSIKHLDVSQTSIISLEIIAELPEITYLNCENTSITTLEPLADMQFLEVLRISNTGIKSLEPVKPVKTLRRIYCDNTAVPKAEAIRFMKDRPECLVIFETQDLLAGWKELEEPWKKIVRTFFEISEPPTQEQLHQVITIDKLDLSGNKEITTLNPVRRLFNLKRLDVSATGISDFSPISEVFEIEELNVSGNNLSQVEFLHKASRLRILNIENTSVKSLAPLEKLSSVRTVYADHSGIDDASAFLFRKANPGAVVVYKTEEMVNWWKGLPVAWKNLFAGQFKIDSPPTKEQLHHILFLDSLAISDNNQIADLSPLSIMKGLKRLYLSGTMVSNLQPIAGLKDMEMLQCNQSPVVDLTPVGALTQLLKLDIANTPVEKLDAIKGLIKLKSLNCSGTQLKSIDPVSGLTQLEEIKINNTQIKSLKPVMELPKLKSLECFNTKISAKSVEKFRQERPGVKVVYY